MHLFYGMLFHAVVQTGGSSALSHSSAGYYLWLHSICTVTSLCSCVWYVTLRKLCGPRMSDPSETLKEPLWDGVGLGKRSEHTNSELLKAHRPLSSSGVFPENGALVSFISSCMCKVKSRGKWRGSNYTFNRKLMFFWNIILSFKTASCLEIIFKPL